jgi:hypothetical protein
MSPNDEVGAEVYARRGDAWKIVQTHWSFASGRRS